MSADSTGDHAIVLRSRELAELARTTPRALRHYHSIGLLAEPPRDGNGYRRYGVDDLLRVLRIRQLSESGVPLAHIADILDDPPSGSDALFDQLDRSLAAQIERLRTQRQTLARLRGRTISTDRLADQSTTAQMDRDMWTLLTATGQLDSTAAGDLLDMLESGPLAQESAAWFEEFRTLEQVIDISDAAADALATRIAAFAEKLMEAVHIDPDFEPSPLFGIGEHMQHGALSPAQRTVWNRVAALMEASADA